MFVTLFTTGIEPMSEIYWFRRILALARHSVSITSIYFGTFYQFAEFLFSFINERGVVIMLIFFKFKSRLTCESFFRKKSYHLLALIFRV